MQKSGIRFLLYVSSILFLSFGSLSIAQETEKPKEETLYDRLGGIHVIAQVVDDFVDRLWVNEVLNANPKNKQAMGISKPALKYLATELTCMAIGGPQKYTGRSLKDAHSGLNISEKEWDAMVIDFKATLNKFKVPVGSVKGDIVMAVEK